MLGLACLLNGLTLVQIDFAYEVQIFDLPSGIETMRTVEVQTAGVGAKPVAGFEAAPRKELEAKAMVTLVEVETTVDVCVLGELCKQLGRRFTDYWVPKADIIATFFENISGDPAEIRDGRYHHPALKRN